MFDYSGTSRQLRNVIQSLKDPIQNIYMAAKHLDILRDMDFSNKSANELTDEEIQIIASCYNIGPDSTMEEAKKCSYGKSIFKNADRILDALN